MPENRQRTGSFKIRGACNHIFQLDKEKGKKGIIAASSGNHGQAVAYAASLLGYPVTIVVPENASPVKVAAAQAYGAEIIRCGTLSTQRRAKAYQLAAERGCAFVHGFDDPHVIAGQGTIGLEILAELPGVDAILVPVGGGGLISGIATAVKESRPGVKVFGVEPSLSNSMYLSLKAGEIAELSSPPKTMADGLRSNKPGQLTFQIVKKYVDDILLVTEEIERPDNLLSGGRCWQSLGAVTVAAALAGKVPLKDKTVVAVVSGGNVDLNFSQSDCGQ